MKMFGKINGAAESSCQLIRIDERYCWPIIPNINDAEVRYISNTIFKNQKKYIPTIVIPFVYICNPNINICPGDFLRCRRRYSDRIDSHS